MSVLNMMTIHWRELYNHCENVPLVDKADLLHNERCNQSRLTGSVHEETKLFLGISLIKKNKKLNGTTMRKRAKRRTAWGLNHPLSTGLLKLI